MFPILDSAFSLQSFSFTNRYFKLETEQVQRLTSFEGEILNSDRFVQISAQDKLGQQSTKSMRFGENLSVFVIPEWKDCYLDYQSLKMLVLIIKTIVQEISIIDLAVSYHEKTIIEPNGDNSSLSTVLKLQSLQQVKQQLKDKLRDVDRLFKKAFLLEMEISELFFQMKLIDMDTKFKNTKQIGCMDLSQKQSCIGDESSLQTFLTLIQYIYIESAYLNEMTVLNLEAERKILKKYKKSLKGMLKAESNLPIEQEFKEPQYDRKMVRLKSKNQKLIDEIQNYYVEHQTIEEETKDRREYLRNTARKNTPSNIDTLLLGIWIGLNLSILAFFIIIIRINNLDFDLDPKFSRDFRTWRGMAIFIFYTWVLGFNTYMFQEYKITHRLIFKFNDHHYSTSVDVFKIAGVLTSVFLVLFFIYVLLLTQSISVGGTIRKEYLALICWGVLGLCLFVPLPVVNHKGRIFALKLLVKSIVSPFQRVTFPITWFTNQVVSLVTPFRDLAYTICYYKELDFSQPPTTNQNPCGDNSRVEIVLLVAIVANSYRILQCMRQGYDTGEYFTTPYFINSLKYACSILTTLLSYHYRIGTENIFVFWIISAGISTVFSYTWDLKMDWGLLQPNERHFLLRKYLTFEPAYNYYIIAVSNLLMRLAWILTLSPSITQSLGNPNVFGLALGMVEIFRRGIWNLLRVEKQHLSNCGKFKALPDTGQIESSLIQNSKQNQLHIVVINFVSKLNYKQTQEEFLNLIREKLVVVEKFKKQHGRGFMNKQLSSIQKVVKSCSALTELPKSALKISNKSKKKTDLKGRNENSSSMILLSQEGTIPGFQIKKNL